MKNKHIESFFKNLGKGYKTPNAGGCGLFALAASTALNAQGIKHKIVVACNNPWQTDSFVRRYGEIKKSCTKQYKALLSQGGYGIHNHIVIDVDGVKYDTEGVWLGNYETQATIDRNTLQRLVKSRDQWNSRFWRGNDQHLTKIDYVKGRAVEIASKKKLAEKVNNV